MKMLPNLSRFILSIFSKRLTFHVDDEIEEEPLVWKPEMITAQIRADNVYLKIGKYLHLEQKLEPGEYGWTMSKFEIPDSWVVIDVSFQGEQLILNVKDSGKFQITPSNFGPLSYAILSAGKGNKVTDQQLEPIWNEHAKVTAG